MDSISAIIGKIIGAIVGAIIGGVTPAPSTPGKDARNTPPPITSPRPEPQPERRDSETDRRDRQ